MPGLFGRLAEAGKEDGIGFRFGGRTGRTRDSHRVVWYAGRKDKEAGEHGNGNEGRGGGGLQTKVVEGLFQAYFEEERNITDRGVLVDAAVQGAGTGTGTGLDGEEIERFLESDEGGAEVDEEAERARRRMVTGVPYFTIQGHYSIGGAEEPDVFSEVFNQIKEDEGQKA